MQIYFKLQYTRLLRGLRDFGINPYLAILICAALFIVASSLLFKRISYPQYIYPVIALIAVLTLSDKKRNQFLKNIFTIKKYQQLRLLENALLTLPFVIFLTMQGYYIIGFITLACNILCSLYNNAGSASFVIPSPFYKRPYEFSVGFRKSYWLFILLYIITGIALAAGNFNLSVFVLLGILLVPLGFYSTAEPEFYVWVHAETAKAFLRRKIITALFYDLCISLPAAASIAFFYPAKAYIVLAIILLGMLYLLMAVLVKYNSYPQQLQLLVMIKMIAGLLVPPFLLILIPHFYLQSVKKLKIYLK